MQSKAATQTAIKYNLIYHFGTHFNISPAIFATLLDLNERRTEYISFLPRKFEADSKMFDAPTN